MVVKIINRKKKTAGNKFLNSKLRNKLNILSKLLFALTLIGFNSCGSKKSASELSNLRYSKILTQENKLINTIGSYASIDTIFSFGKKNKDDITTSLMKFNKDKTVQLSNDSNIKITNDNLTDYLKNYTSYYYYLKTSSILILERYEGSLLKTPFYAWAGPPTKPYKVSIKFKIKGDTLMRVKYSKEFKKRYILNPKLINNHEGIKSEFKRKASR